MASKAGWTAWIDDVLKTQRSWQKARLHWALREEDQVLRMFCWKCDKVLTLVSRVRIPEFNAQNRRSFRRSMRPIFDAHLHAPKRGRPRKLPAKKPQKWCPTNYLASIPKTYLDL